MRRKQFCSTRFDAACALESSLTLLYQVLHTPPPNALTIHFFTALLYPTHLQSVLPSLFPLSCTGTNNVLCLLNSTALNDPNSTLINFTLLHTAALLNGRVRPTSFTGINNTEYGAENQNRFQNPASRQYGIGKYGHNFLSLS